MGSQMEENEMETSLRVKTGIGVVGGRGGGEG